MIRRYIFGNPIDTEAVMEKPDASVWISEKKDNLPGERLTYSDDRFFCRLYNDEIVYGLGESVRGINKRGWIYEANNTDDPEHTENKRSLYGSHNFLLLDGGNNAAAGGTVAGFFIDTPGRVTFDIGYTKYDELIISFDKPDFELYTISAEHEIPGESIYENIIRQFRMLIGQSYIAPLWSFGMGQCRWSYMTSDEIRDVVKSYKEKNIPLDSVYLDIDYMERYKDFTINRETFADFEELVDEMKAQSIHLVPIIDGGIKIEDDYDVYEEGKESGYFCTDAEGNNFVVGVWPGRCCFPDMLNDDARKWFGRKYKVLLDKGIDGFWNDMNEPAIFYSEKRLNGVFEKIEEYKGKNLDIESFFKFRDLAITLSGNPEDYTLFYHNYKGKRYCHKDVHNLFGYFMTKAAGEAFDELSPDKRILIFSRSSYIGMHRYGGIWQGDNQSWWSHLLLNIKMMPSLNMCGFIFTGADIGGFGSDVTEDLLLRWLSFGVFTPLMRNHSALGTRRQEPYCFEETDKFRNVVSTRYRLLPYLYSEYMKASIRGTMMFRPLAFVFEDEISRHTEDQLLIGDSIMIAPVYEQNAVGRVVYVPSPMKLIRFTNGEIKEEEILEKGHHFIYQPLGDVCIFLRENHLIPLSKSAENVKGVDYDNPTLYSFGENPLPYEYYMDDGETKEFDENKYLRMLN